MHYDVGFEIEQGRLDALIAAAGKYGMTVSEDWNEPEGARFIGTFEGTHATLYPKFDPGFALFFTVAHLYGHMAQTARPTVRASKTTAGDLIGAGRPLTNHEVQMIYDHEREAAAIGRTLIAELGAVSELEDRQYMRLFLADYHYLIHFIESGEKGTDAFARFLRREPLPQEKLAPDPRPLVDLRHGPKGTGQVVVV